MKHLYLFFSGIALIAVFLLLDQIWFGLVSFESFWKILVTLAIIGGGALIVFLIRNELLEDKELKKDKYLD